MKKLIAMTLLTISYAAMAESNLEASLSANLSKKSRFYKSNFYVGMETANWEYTEEVDQKLFMKDSGRLNGINLNYEYLLSNQFYFWNIGYRYLSGGTTYEGGAGGKPLTLESKNSISQLQIKQGPVFSLTENSIMKFHLGISLRSLNNPKDDYPGSYSRQSRYLTAPIGAELVLNPFSSKHFFSLSANYDYLLYAETSSNLSEASRIYPNVTNEQKRGKGYRLALKYNADFQDFSIKVSPYYRLWDFEDSEPQVIQLRTVEDFVYAQATVTEPKNKTEIIGLNVSAGF